MKKIISIIITTTLATIIGFSQNADIIKLYTGKEIKGKITEIGVNKIKISNINKSLFRSRKVQTENIFSYTCNNNTIILYRRDITILNSYSIAQMRQFINGYAHAKTNYHAPLASLGGFATGITGGIFGFWGTTIPTCFVLTSGIKTPAYNHIHISEQQLADIHANTLKSKYGKQTIRHTDIELTDEIIFRQQYAEGYCAAAKDKKIKNAMKGSIIGFIGFVVTATILAH